MLLVAAYWRAHLTLRQLGLVCGASKSAADRAIARLRPKLALQPIRRFAKGTVLIVDGTLVPTHDHKVAGQPPRLSGAGRVRRQGRRRLEHHVR